MSQLQQQQLHFALVKLFVRYMLTVLTVMFIICLLYVYYMFIAYFLFIACYCMFLVCFLSVDCMLIACLLYAYCMFFVCLLHVFCMFFVCLLFVYCLSIVCLLFVYCLSIVCLLLANRHLAFFNFCLVLGNFLSVIRPLIDFLLSTFSGDILESFADHPPLSLPSTGFVLDMENGPSDSTFYDFLDAINTALQSGMHQSSSRHEVILGFFQLRCVFHCFFRCQECGCVQRPKQVSDNINWL